MSKVKTSFVCQECGAESAKWLGKCPSCNAWNSLVEEVVRKEPQRIPGIALPGHSGKATSQKLGEINIEDNPRLLTRDHELNRVLGGGIVEGSVILVAGDPGIGKSTLFLQVCLQLTDTVTLYISGEESLQQIKMRAERLGLRNEHFYLLTSTNTQLILEEINRIKPQLIVIDSIQTLESPQLGSAAGSVSQVRECAGELIRFAKGSQIPVIIIGHITKDGSIAGPKVLEHMVDTVLQFEGDRHYSYRILRTTKNRFGGSNELGIYEMRDGGLRQINNPSEILLSAKDQALSGVAIGAIMEGARPLLIETQALVAHSVYGTPQRTVNGYDLRKLQLLLAVLEKRGGFHFGLKDVFLNMAGGIKVEDPAIDLAVVCALLSSYEDKPVPSSVCFAGEVGLSGEVRAVSRITQRIAEAEKLGFERIMISAFNQKGVEKNHKIQVSVVRSIEEIYNLLF